MLAIVAGMVVLAGGCFTTPLMRPARTASKGTISFHAGPTAILFDTPREKTWYPQLEAGLHYSINDHWEIGGKLHLLGLALDSKIALVRSRTSWSGFSLSIAPEVGGMAVCDSSVNACPDGALAMTFGLSVLGGIPVAGHELMLAARLNDWLDLTTRPSRHVLYAGGGIGFAFHPGVGFRIIPNVFVMAPIAGEQIFRGDNGVAGLQSVVVVLGLSFMASGK